MAVTRQKVERPALTADYDPHADVLYLSLGEPREGEGEDLERGIVVRYPFHSNEAMGVTIVGYKANKWPSDLKTLSLKIANLLSLQDVSEIHRLILYTVGRAT